ncbi:hypothetical protein [Amycolatopsis sp. NPDC051372]|uniref:hypothetical protein n=1 Tax=Amycolatopsis sp. NPDC051372 TaxID=3155669 RepID=UPI0034270BB2
MKTIRRIVAASAIALPLTLGAAGIASADTYTNTNVAAGPDGVSTSSTHASTGEQSGESASYHQQNSNAGPDGVSNDHTTAGTDGNGGASFDQGQSWAGPDGAQSSHTGSNTDANTDSGSGHGVLTGIVGSLRL